MNIFSFIRETANVTDVDPLAPFLKLTNTVRHDYGGTTTQVLSIKKLKDNALDLSFTPNNGQNLKVAVSYDLDGVKAWVTTHGQNVTGVAVYDVTPSGRTISTPVETDDKYVWVAIALQGYIGYPANGYLSNPEHTYSYVINGAVTAPESLLMFTSESAATPSGTFDNPALIQPNSTDEYDSRYGQCVAGAYYFSFSGTLNISRHLTITPSTPRSIGVVISTVKNDVKNWILNGGTGTLTNGSNNVNVGNAPLNVTVEPLSNVTYYAAVYDPTQIGADSCVTGNPFTVVSVQENQSGSSSGTYANPFVISNNLQESIASEHTLASGECAKGAVYYMFEKCTSSSVPLTITLHTSSLSQNVAVAYSTDKTALGTFIRTGVIGSLVHIASNGVDANLVLTQYGADNYAFLVVYDPTSIGTFSCTSTDTFKISTSQLNCGGGGSGRDGRYINPFDYTSNWSNILQADGDCDIDGTIWFNLGGNCQGTLQLYINPRNGQNVRLAYGITQAAVKAYIEGGGGGSGGGACGHFDSPSNVPYSGYYDGAGTYYYNNGYNVWESSDTSTMYYSQYDLPDYCGENCGYFDNPGDKYYSAYNDTLNGIYYNNNGYDAWYYNSQYTIYYFAEGDLPGFCSITCGRFIYPYNASFSDYVSSDGTYYTNTSENEWSDGTTTYTDMTTLPDYCDPMTCGAFEEPANYETSTWYDQNGNAYYANGANMWADPNPGWQQNDVYGITNLPNYCDGSGGGGSGGSGGGSVMSIGAYENAYVVLNNNNYYAAAYLPDAPGATQCENFDKFDVSAYTNCGYGGGGEQSGGSYTDTDPLPIGNNGSFSGNFTNSNECPNGNFYMRGYFCSQPFNISVSTGVTVQGIGWSNSLSALRDWITSGRSGSPTDYGGTMGGFENTSNASVSNSFTGNIYFVAFTDVDSCFGNTSVNINTEQNNCDGSPIGTSESPIAIGNSETLSVDANAGNCFNGRTYMSVTLCSDKAATFTITPASNATPQAFIMADEIYKIVYTSEYYMQSGYFYTYEGTVYSDAASTTASPLVINIPAQLGQRNLYFVLCDRFATGTSGLPRCDRTGSMTVTVAQDCPITNIGGVADISGAGRYNYDPYDTVSTNKRGIALVGGDPAAMVTRNLIYIPTLVVDDAASYGVAISAASITSELYTNSNLGVTTLAAVKATTKTEAIVKDNKVYIKPLGTNELQFDNASFYTALFVNTFETNVGTFIRNQVVNAGDNFTGGRSQYAYVTGISGNEISAIVPLTQELVHTITHDSTVTGSAVSRANTVKIITNAPQETGAIVDTPSISDDDANYHIRVRI